MLKEAIEQLGGQTVFARMVGARQQEVWNWLNGRAVPVRRCAAIERATGGAVTRRDLRPDDWQDIWPELAALQEKQTPEPADKAPAAINCEVTQRGAHA